MTDLCSLVQQATPGPWEHESPGSSACSMLVAHESRIIVCDPYGPNPQDARLIALAPVLAQLVIDMADTLKYYEGCNEILVDVLTEDFEVVHTHECEVARALLARFAALTEEPT